MNWHKLLIPTAVMLSCAGCLCLSTLNPIYQDRQVVFDPSFLGTYRYQDDQRFKAEVSIEKLEDKHYKIIVREGYSSYQLRGVLVQIGELRFVDLSPLEGIQQAFPRTMLPDNPIEAHFWQSAHVIFKLLPGERELKLATVDWLALSRLLTKDPSVLKMGGRLITSSTEELQGFLVKYGNGTNIFSQELVLGTKIEESR